MNERFQDARTLAEFSNLETAGAEYFQQNYPEFLPSSLWKTFSSGGGPQYALTSDGTDYVESGKQEKPYVEGPPWSILRDSLQKAWRDKFPIEEAVGLINFHGVGLFHMGDIAVSGAALGKTTWPFQRAVMFLASESWRARFCVCGKRFVADIPGRRYCSDKCFQDSRKAAMKSWWNAPGGGSEQRRKSRKPKGKTRRTRNRGEKSK
jgi:hypothetical protein